MRCERGHPEALFGNLAGALERPGAERLLDFGDREEMVAHVGEEVLLHRRGHRDEGTRVAIGGACHAHRGRRNDHMR